MGRSHSPATGNQPVLLNPGPVNVSPRVRQALLGPDLCHREPEFAAVVQSVRARLVRCFGGPAAYGAVALTGSGTLAVEAMISSGVGSGTLLVVNNGVYGQRIADMAAAHGIPARVIESSWVAPLDVGRLEECLRADPAIEAIAVVHHETTTGLLNPVAEIGALGRRHGKRLLVDGVSSLAGDGIDLERDGVDLIAGTANKCLQGLPGICFVLARRDTLAALAAVPPRSVYLHLPSHFAAQERGSMLFTMAVQAAYACDAALAELEEETVAGRVARYRGAAELLRAGFAALGLECIVPAGHRSNSLTALRLPPDLAYARLHAELKARGFVIYEGQARLQSEIFRVANMGHLTRADFTRFLEALSDILQGAGVRSGR
jgi:2-aminoethylphosphonate-pyruvate transaminase